MTPSDLERATGELRDALSALKGFSTLVRSMRVSPRSVETALEDVEAACDQFAGAARAGITLLDTAFGIGSSGELLNTAIQCCDRLRSKVAGARPMNATRRLDLEQVAVSTVAELEGCLGLFELLKEAATSTPILVNASSLLARGRGSDPDLQPTKRTVLARLELDIKQPEILIQPRVLTLILGCSVAHATAPQIARCVVHMSDTPQGGFQLSVTRDPGPPHGSEVEIVAPCVLPASLTCCQTAAQVSSATVAWHSSPPSALLTWPSV